MEGFDLPKNYTGYLRTMCEKLFNFRNYIALASMLVFAGLLPQTGSFSAFAQDQIKTIIVESIEPAYVEKGEINYLISLRAIITNHGESETVAVEVTGTDENGHTLKHVRFSGDIPKGSTRVLTEQFQMRGEDYEAITSWVENQ
jgi:hypothetical protein